MNNDQPTAAQIAKRIRLQVERHNLTIAKASETCGISNATFEDYLYARHMPGSVALAALAKGLCCPVGWLLTGEFDR